MWGEFRDIFTSLVISDEKLSNSDRMQYLKSHLEGNAAEVISGFSLEGENFSRAWESLTEEYENLRMYVVHNFLAFGNFHEI